MALNNLAELLEKRRTALVEYCLGQVKTAGGKYNFLRTPADLFELLRMDPLDSYPVQSSWVAEATSCAQQFIHAAYRKLEPGYEKIEFDKRDLATWELYNNYPDWAALQLIALYPENFINPFVRRRKTSLFKTLENNLNQTRLNADSVQAALQDYLQSFEQICNLDVISGYMDGATPDRADYYFVGRQRVPPFQYFWRKAEVELSSACVAINPAAWSEWQPVDIPAGAMVLDMRPVFWSGRLCLVWAQWQAKVEGQEGSEGLPPRLDINVSFMAQNGNWSAPLSLHSSARDEDNPPQSARLIATVWADQSHPKGRLGVMLIGEDLKVFAVRDVLFRPVDWDDGGWLEKAALIRFTTAETVQHPLTNQPTMVISDAASGSLTPYLGLQAVAFRVGNDDKLFVQGFCRPTGLTGNDVTLKLELQNPASGDPAPIAKAFPVAGGWSTQWLELKRLRGSWQDPVFLFGAETGGHGRKRFQLTVKDLTDFTPVTLSKNTLDAAQFLSLNQSGLALKYTRLNSLFGPELVQRSNISVDAVLDWDTQFLSEPPPLGVPGFSEPNGAFNGANGLFFWELFFHLPHLVAARLRAEDRFLEAQNWLHYLFDPQAPADPGQSAVANPKPLYWRCRPLNGPGNLGCEADAPTDPDAIGYSAPRHFQIVVFTEYVKNLIAWGDWYYRQLTRDSLVAAKLCYVQAEFLMGKAPEVRTVNRWETDTVGSLMNKSLSRPALEQFEKELVFSLADFPATAEAPPLLGLLANEPFKAPINEQLLALYDLPDQRLYNLRNNLTLDGKPLDIPLFSPPTDPNQLLRDLAAGSGGARPMGGRLVVGAFRWRVTYETALRAVQSLQDHGNQVLRLLEQRDRAEQEEMQQNHLVELGSYAQTVQEQSITQLQASTAALEQSRAMAQERAEAYARRYDENVSEVEYQVMENLQLSKKLELASSSIKPAGAVVAAVPTIFGLANGGHRLDKAFDAVSFVLSVAASAMQIDADKQATTEGYRRRREEWQLQRDQALAEVRAIDAQITAQTHALQAAQTTLAQTLTANSQALTVYNFIKKRASNAELFGWLLGQLKALHYQAYDAVVSLCLNAQAALTAETGDYDAQIPLPQVWLDNRHGLTVGEHLHGHLLRMEREYLQRHERRMELVKTVSLRRLFDDPVERQAGVDSWEAALLQLQTHGTLEFALTQLLFDRDHPGHYCRQISAVEVDLPVVTGPFENVRATLLQIGSMIATKASVQSVRYLHSPGEFVAPSDIQINLRSGQQIALSMGLGDNGMTAMKPDEGLLNPFENTGVVSRWMVKFPWPTKAPQQQVLASLTDIIVRIRYTAKAGEPTFTRAVEDRVRASEIPDGFKQASKE